MISPPPTVRDLELWAKHCAEVRALAQQIIEGEVGIIEGSRRMLAYRTSLHAGDAEEFRIFRGVESESDHLPIGKVRELWSASALREKDVEIKAFEDFYRQQVVEAATKIRQKYG